MMAKKQRRQLRIALVCFSQARGGLELMLTKIAAALVGRGHAPYFFAPGGSPLEEESRKKEIPFTPLTPLVRYLDIVTSLRLRREMQRHSVNVLLLGRSRDVSTCVLAGFFGNSPKLVFLQQMQFGLQKKDPFHRWAYGSLDLWVTLTEAMKLAVLENTTIVHGKIRVIPFGVDLRHFDPSIHRRENSRRVFGLPPKKTIVALVGRFDKQKGHEYFLRAIPMVLASVPKIHFVLLGEETQGEPGYLGELRHLVRSLAISDHVSFLPFTEKVPEFLAACDLIAVPSLSETFGYVAVEAMAMGIPVVGTRAGGLPEIILDGKTGLLVPPGNSHALAGAITTLSRSKQLRSKMGKAGRTRASRLFDFEKNIDALEESLLGLF